MSDLHHMAFEDREWSLHQEQMRAEYDAQMESDACAREGVEEEDIIPEVEPVVLAIESAIVAQDLQRRFDETHPH